MHYGKSVLRSYNIVHGTVQKKKSLLICTCNQFV